MKSGTGRIKIISFDVEGTLASPDFSQAVWYEGLPSLYAEKYQLSFAEALNTVKKAYDEVGDKRTEWYDIKYWFERFQLGDYHTMLQQYSSKAACYPEVAELLPILSRDYRLIITSSSAREFLKYLLAGIDGYFSRVFSSISDYGQLKSKEFYITVCREMKTRPEELVHIGDNWQFDILAAQEAGIKAFHIERNKPLEDTHSLRNITDIAMKLRNLG